MTSEEFRRLVADQLDNACRDPMGREAAIAEIVGTYEQDVSDAYQRGQANVEESYEGYVYME